MSGRPLTFTVTTPSEKVTLDESGRARAQFTVTNVSAEPVKGRLLPKPRKPAKPEWFSVADESVRVFAPNATQQAVVQLNVPKGSRPGPYRFRLDAVSEAAPDEDFTEGPWVAFEVAPQAKKAFPWWIAAAAAAVIGLILGGLIGWLVGRGGGEEPEAVPAVTSMSASVANSTLTGAGFTVTTRSVPVSDPPKNGDVQSQDPAAGTAPPPGTPVTITVGRMSLVPSVTGRSEATARRMLGEADLGVTVRYAGAEGPRPDLIVLDQDPASGTLREPESAVKLTVGPELVVPDVRNKHQLLAEIALWNAGLPGPPEGPVGPEPRLKFEMFWVPGPDNLVISQIPAPGATLPYGSVVQVGVGL